MALPAVAYSLFNWSNAHAMRGWAIPVATDIAFSLGVLSILGRPVPVALKVFLAALAIIDDLVAIVVIAVFYTRELALPALAVAVLAWLVLFGLSRAGVRAISAYLAGGLVICAAPIRSGVPPALAGVAWPSSCRPTGNRAWRRCLRRRGFAGAVRDCAAVRLSNAGLASV